MSEFAGGAGGRAFALAKKAKKMVDDEKLDAQEVPLRTAVPLLEAASLEDDESLVDRWAALLANATGMTMDVPPSFPQVLRELDPGAALLLDSLHDDYMGVAPEIRQGVTIYFEDDEKLSVGDFRFHIDNLTRLGLIRSFGLDEDDHYDSFVLTAFGRSFVRACRPPGTPDPPVEWTDRDALIAHINERQQREAEVALQETDSSDEEGPDDPSP